MYIKCSLTLDYTSSLLIIADNFANFLYVCDIPIKNCEIMDSR